MARDIESCWTDKHRTDPEYHLYVEGCMNQWWPERHTAWDIIEEAYELIQQKRKAEYEEKLKKPALKFYPQGTPPTPRCRRLTIAEMVTNREMIYGPPKVPHLDPQEDIDLEEWMRFNKHALEAYRERLQGVY